MSDSDILLKFDRIKQGSSFIRVFQFKNKDTGTPINLEGYGIRMQFRAYSASGDLIGEASTANGYFVTNYNNELGTVLLNIPASITRSWPVGKVVYDCELYYPLSLYPEGRTDTMFEGYSKVVEEVTKGLDILPPVPIVFMTDFSNVNNSMYLPLIF